MKTRLIKTIQGNIPNLLVKIHYCSELNEYTVSGWLNNIHRSKDDYYTDCKEDAINTGKAMLKQYEQYLPTGLVW